MKANEAPEKIYLFENPISNTPDERWLGQRSGDDDIEYTRTDTFMKNAANWLMNNTDISSTGIKNFYKAMEGGKI